jgi:hypothetical protein
MLIKSRLYHVKMSLVSYLFKIPHHQTVDFIYNICFIRLIKRKHDNRCLSIWKRSWTCFGYLLITQMGPCPLTRSMIHIFYMQSWMVTGSFQYKFLRSTTRRRVFLCRIRETHSTDYENSLYKNNTFIC